MEGGVAARLAVSKAMIRKTMPPTPPKGASGGLREPGPTLSAEEVCSQTRQLQQVLPANHPIQAGLDRLLTEHLLSVQTGRNALLRLLAILGHIQTDKEIAWAKVDEVQRDMDILIREHEFVVETHNLPMIRAVRRILQGAILKAGVRDTIEPLLEPFVDMELLYRRVDKAGAEADEALAMVWGELSSAEEVQTIMANFAPGKGRPPQSQGFDAAAEHQSPTGGDEQGGSTRARRPPSSRPMIEQAGAPATQGKADASR